MTESGENFRVGLEKNIQENLNTILVMTVVYIVIFTIMKVIQTKKLLKIYASEKMTVNGESHL